MKYYFTAEQFYKMWNESFSDYSSMYSISASARVRYWQTYLESKFKLTYIESLEWGTPDEFGVIEGEEKDINWFLMHGYC